VAIVLLQELERTFRGDVLGDRKISRQELARVRREGIVVHEAWSCIYKDR
jgi:hypothetical protein